MRPSIVDEFDGPLGEGIRLGKDETGAVTCFDAFRTDFGREMEEGLDNRVLNQK